MLSKNQIKFIRSLKKKKFRQANKLFLAEGIKVVEELLASEFELYGLYATSSYKNPFEIKELEIIEDRELALISDFTNPNQVFGIFKIPEHKTLLREGLTLVLDEINDPGNLGTIIRLCDWFGVQQIVCSENTVDCYNQKVVQASMGSLTRVAVNYLNILDYLKSETRMIYGTFLNGENIYTISPEENAVLILGNEANGISEEVKKMVRKKLTIPKFGESQKTESLNVATATAIFLSEFRR